MNKLKKLSKKTKILIIVFIITFLVILFVLLNIDTRTDEQKAYDKVETMAKEFYSGYYYSQNSDSNDKNRIKVFLSNYTETGITINLENLEKFYYSQDNNKKISFEALKDCDVEETKAIIYPNPPYGKEDYTINVKLSCKFKK